MGYTIARSDARVKLVAREQPLAVKALPRGPQALPPAAVAAEHRRRLIEAAVELLAEDRDQALTIGALTARARVSRGAFYEVFPNRLACLVAACEDRIGRLVAAARTGWARANGDPLEGLIEALLRTLDEDPASARVVFVELPALGFEAMQARARTLDGLEELWERASARERIDLPLRAVTGALQKIVGGRLLRGEPRLFSDIAAELTAWAATYAVTGPRRPPPTRLRPMPAPRRTKAGPRTEARPLAAGRHGLERQFVIHDQRERILAAMADAIAEHGYSATSIGEVVARARVSRQTFYMHFSGKHDCFRQARDVGAQQIMLATATGFSSGDGSWASSIWHGLRAFTGFLASEPGFARLGLMEVMAAGPESALTLDQTLDAFAVAITPAYELDARTAALPRLCSEAIAGGIWELCVEAVVAESPHELVRTLPEMVYVAIAPFLGPAEAHRAVTRWARSER
jgi:AcrR family transcriptional regulator